MCTNPKKVKKKKKRVNESKNADVGRQVVADRESSLHSFSQNYFSAVQGLSKNADKNSGGVNKKKALIKSL